MRLAVAAGAAFVLSGCVNQVVEPRVERALLDAGLSEQNSACMAERMVDRLSIAQLRKLEGLRARKGETRKPSSLRDFVNRVRRVGDAETLAVTSTSAGLCATGLASEAQRN